MCQVSVGTGVVFLRGAGVGVAGARGVCGPRHRFATGEVRVELVQEVAGAVRLLLAGVVAVAGAVLVYRLAKRAANMI